MDGMGQDLALLKVDNFGGLINIQHWSSILRFLGRVPEPLCAHVSEKKWARLSTGGPSSASSKPKQAKASSFYLDNQFFYTSFCHFECICVKNKFIPTSILFERRKMVWVVWMNHFDKIKSMEKDRSGIWWVTGTDGQTRTRRKGFDCCILVSIRSSRFVGQRLPVSGGPEIRRVIGLCERSLDAIDACVQKSQ
jgi:hypothetical protein